MERLLFEAVSGLGSRAEREQLLEYACRGDGAMRENIESLLDLQDEADDFFEFEPTVEGEEPGGVAEESPELGVSIGRYRLIERLGAGGCGVVYLAEQQQPVRRKVALKIIRLGMNTKQEVTARFEAESQALASLNHPNISRVLDAGTSRNGVPFFVMELVDGETITDYCDSRRLGIEDRLELFLKTCRAIQHAHQRGVVHRDIKPSNILVESHQSVGVVKVIDFGIAGQLGETEEGGFIGTPAYMSPELALRVGPVDTRSDVYSLGVLLAELLSGPPRHLPEGLLDRKIGEVREILLKASPVVPSEALSGMAGRARSEVVDQRGISEGRLVRWCQRDLDWIVRKAVDPDPARRYPTVNGLGVDVERCLRQEPVMARPPGRRYRLGKLVRRNRAVFGAGAIAVLGLLVGGGMATFLFFRERDARGHAERALAAEAAMRERSENWARVAEAAVKVRDGDFEGADQLLSGIPVAMTPSSLEAVDTYRRLADWHLLEGRLSEVDNRYLAMAFALARVEKRDSDAVSRNLLPAATAVCVSHDAERYEWFRGMAIERFGDTNQAVVAEQIVKACLLLPADDETLAELRPLVGEVERALEDEESRTATDPDLRSWACFSLALMRYREGDLGSAAAWGERCLSTEAVNPTVPISARIVLGLVAQRQGRTAEAEALFRRAAADSSGRLVRARDVGITDKGFWFDWANVSLLLEEAGWRESGETPPAHPEG